MAGTITFTYDDGHDRKGANGYVILMSVGDEAVLTTLVRKDAKLGLIFLDMRRSADDLEKLV